MSRWTAVLRTAFSYPLGGTLTLNGRPPAPGARGGHRVARDDAAHPSLRGACRRDVRESQGRRLPASGHRGGGDDRGFGGRAARRRLPDLAIGEEATIVGSVRALRDADYLISTYRSHGHALARGTNPDAVMAELFGKQDGLCRGRGGSMHMFDLERRFMGGYGIVGGNLPIAAGFGLSSDYRGTDDATLCQFGYGASNQGTFGETLNLAALWHLPIVFMVTNNRFGMGTALERHSAVTDLH